MCIVCVIKVWYSVQLQLKLQCDPLGFQPPGLDRKSDPLNLQLLMVQSVNKCLMPTEL